MPITYRLRSVEDGRDFLSEFNPGYDELLARRIELGDKDLEGEDADEVLIDHAMALMNDNSDGDFAIILVEMNLFEVIFDGYDVAQVDFDTNSVGDDEETHIPVNGVDDLFDDFDGVGDLFSDFDDLDSLLNDEEYSHFPHFPYFVDGDIILTTPPPPSSNLATLSPPLSPNSTGPPSPADAILFHTAPTSPASLSPTTENAPKPQAPRVRVTREFRESVWPTRAVPQESDDEEKREAKGKGKGKGTEKSSDAGA